MKRLAWTFTVAVWMCALAGQSLAQENAAGADRKWYGGQTILADAVSGTLFVVGAATAKAPIAYVGLASYLAAPAVIHGVHQHGMRTGLSVLMRVGLPIIGGLVGYEAANCHEPEYHDEPDWCGFVPAMVGMGLGALTSSIVDASIAWDTAAPVQPAPSPAPIKTSAVSFTAASIVPTPNGPRLMIGGRF